VRNRYVLAADLLAIVLCLLGAFVLRLDWFFQRQPEYTAAFNFALVAALVVKPIVYFAFGLYRRYWRYAGLPDLLVIVLAVSASAAAVALVIAGGIMAGVVPFFPRSILALDWLLTLACVGGIRVFPNWYHPAETLMDERGSLRPLRRVASQTQPGRPAGCLCMAAATGLETRMDRCCEDDAKVL